MKYTEKPMDLRGSKGKSLVRIRCTKGMKYCHALLNPINPQKANAC